MEDHHHHHQEEAAGKGQGLPPNSRSGGNEAAAVRSRWIPKAEQILILESIFNSGMVNPPKEETVRIRKLLEKFGSVGDANVFYWFQNRRSRSRRRQRQLQATLLLDQQQQQQINNAQVGGAVITSGAPPPPPMQPSADVLAYGAAAFGSNSNNYDLVGDSSSASASMVGGATEDANFYFGCSSGGQIGFPEMDHASCADETSATFGAANLHHFQTAGMNLMMTVFINGVAAEVPRGPLDLKAMFGTQDVLLFHSSGVPLPINEFGFLAHGLQPGESYFLVSRPN